MSLGYSQVQTARLSSDQDVLVAFGANLPTPRFGAPLDACRAALDEMTARGIVPHRVSPWYESAPVPPSDQNWYVNGVASIEATSGPAELLAILHRIEADFGRSRRVRNEARVIDLDLLAYGRLITAPPAQPALPHPRMCDRAFVLLPLRDVAPDWRHPVTGRTIDELIAALPAGQVVHRLEC
jgi:2-amino-4-hydroxy-6-hydroxymethyldihydropteridine diphosphokinase